MSKSRHCITARKCTAQSMAAPRRNTERVASRHCNHQAMHRIGVYQYLDHNATIAPPLKRSMLLQSSIDRTSCLLETARIQWGLHEPSSPKRTYRTLAIASADRMATRENRESPVKSSSCHRPPGDPTGDSTERRQGIHRAAPDQQANIRLRCRKAIRS